MKLVVFGLSVSSSWGNGHATLWRGLIRALAALGHRTVFFERNQPFYSQHRDCTELPGCELIIYANWNDVLPTVRRHLAEADVGMVTSYCGDGPAACAEVLDSAAAVRAFYDLDTPITIDDTRAGREVPFLPRERLRGFDVVLSYTGGEALEALTTELGARVAVPLYGSVDPTVHYPAAPSEAYRADISYLGTYAANRQRMLEALFIEPARRRPGKRFLIGGAQYPGTFPWTPNIAFIPHVAPAEHPSFYCSSPLSLNVTREPMAAMGYCPSGRFFEAAACGRPLLSDWWEGIDTFFTPGQEMLIARSTEDALDALDLPHDMLRKIGSAARDRTLAEHTATQRARELVEVCECVARGELDDPTDVMTTGGW